MKNVFRSGTQFLDRDLPHTGFRRVRPRQCQEGVGRLHRSAAVGQSEAAPPPAAPAVAFPKINKELAKKNFFEYLDFALQFAPAGTDRSRNPRTTGQHRRRSRQDVQLHRPAFEAETGNRHRDEAGANKVDVAVAKAGTVVNGWNVSGLLSDSAHYNGDWLARAVAAQAGIYDNSPEEAMYPFTRKDSTGRTLDGGNYNHTITFPAGQLPPVNAFWSLTMYDGKSQLLIKNLINRYLINAPMLPGLKKNADGSLTLYIQNKSPGRYRESNWLPAPAAQSNW
jgi:hypothetical protein